MRLRPLPQVLVPFDRRERQGLAAPCDWALRRAVVLLDEFFDGGTGEGVRAKGAVEGGKGLERELKEKGEGRKGRTRCRGLRSLRE
jgi:hypothetical protein